jgi:CrcB protein
MTWLLVALGGAGGAAARHLGDSAIRARWPGRFPWGILLVNLSGSFLLGLLGGAGLGPRWGALLAVGSRGAFTTRSTARPRRRLCARQAALVAAVLDLAASVAGGLLAVALGAWVGAGMGLALSGAEAGAHLGRHVGSTPLLVRAPR